MNGDAREPFAIRLASHFVQAAFVVAILILWFLATNVWGVSSILLPSPDQCLASAS
jgi:hypothetical protein